MIPGEIQTGDGDILINPDRDAIEIVVANRGDRPVQVGSHFHFFEVNRALAFDRAQAFGRRLDIPAGTAVRFEPGAVQTIALIPLGGRRRSWGLNGLTNGAVDESGWREQALERARQARFLDGPAATDAGTKISEDGHAPR